MAARPKSTEFRLGVVYGFVGGGVWWFRSPLLGHRGLWHKDRARHRLYFSERNWHRPFDFAIGTHHFKFLGKHRVLAATICTHCNRLTDACIRAGDGCYDDQARPL